MDCLLSDKCGRALHNLEKLDVIPDMIPVKYLHDVFLLLFFWQVEQA